MEIPSETTHVHAVSRHVNLPTGRTFVFFNCFVAFFVLGVAGLRREGGRDVERESISVGLGGTEDIH